MAKADRGEGRLPGPPRGRRRAARRQHRARAPGPAGRPRGAARVPAGALAGLAQASLLLAGRQPRAPPPTGRATVDYEQRYGLVATGGTRHRIVGHAGYERTDGDRAEVAFEVADDYQGRGLGTILLAHLAEAAQEQGVEVFEADRAARQLPDGRGLPRERVRSADPLEARPDLRSSSRRRCPRRRSSASRSATAPPPSRRSATSSSRSSVAVIGASRERGTVGGEIFHNLLAAGFNGPVFPVNPTRRTSCSPCRPSSRSGTSPARSSWRSWRCRPQRWSTSRASAPQRACGALVVISAGFAETGEEGAQAPAGAARGLPRERHAPDRPQLPRHPQHLDEVRLNASFGPLYPPRGQRRASSRRAARWAWRSSTSRGSSSSGSRRSCRSATRRTSRATT